MTKPTIPAPIKADEEYPARATKKEIAAAKRKAESATNVRSMVADQTAAAKPRKAGRRKVDTVAAKITEVMAQALDIPVEDVASIVKVSPAIPSTGYQGPMLALRDRIKRGMYQKAANGQPSCGDEVAQVLGQLEPAEVIRACLIAMDLNSNPYLHLNIGQQSMNLRNKLRGIMKRGDLGMGVVREAAEVVIEGRATKK